MKVQNDMNIYVLKKISRPADFFYSLSFCEKFTYQEKIIFKKPVSDANFKRKNLKFIKKNTQKSYLW